MPFPKGNIPWNKGKTGIYSNNVLENMSEKHKGKKLSKKHKENIGKSCKGRIFSDSHKRNISETKKGENNPMYDVHRFGKESPNWKGGKRKQEGYVEIFEPTHPVNNYKYVKEHRLIVEQQIGRYLKLEEICHHRNRIRDDNRPENLMAFTSESAHQRFHRNPDSVKLEEIIFDGRKL